jgi:hypothetical protein
VALHLSPGWTNRLGDMGRSLGISAFAVGKILQLLGYRSERHVTDAAVLAGCGPRRWDGFVMHDDWHAETVVSIIRSEVQDSGRPEVGEALMAAIASHESRKRVAAKRREQEETDTKRRQEEEAVVSMLEVELRASRTVFPMSKTRPLLLR